MKILEIRDNGGITFDRYTVVYDQIERPGFYCALGMSQNPIDPLGFGQHCIAQPGPHLGKILSFEDLPRDCQSAVRRDLP